MVHSSIGLALAAVIVEAAIGYPGFVYRLIGHPVTWMGALLAWLEHRLNHAAASERRRRVLGGVVLGVLLAVTAVVSLAVVGVFSWRPIGTALLIVTASSLLAQRSLDQHVRAVALALERHGLEAGRQAVARIVGRNPAFLDEAGVARAAIESLAENFSDGIVAPVFWLAVAGLPGAALYKATNTADSMIGHRTPRYAAFGWAAARVDDLVNLPASRLAALFLVIGACLVGGRPGEALHTVWRDARRHRSPNAGWPEAAMAGALGLQLAGPRVYGDQVVSDAFMGSRRRDANAADIRRGLLLFRVACGVQAVVLLALLLIAPS